MTFAIECGFINIELNPMNAAANESNPDVFVVVPSYNHAPFIEICLRSIIGQTRSPKKLLVIDDGSRDDSPAIIDRVLKDCPFDSELIVRENRGLCRTLNQAFELSTGKYFAYIGSDDYWLEGFIENRVKLLEGRPGAALGYGHAYFVDENGREYDSTAEYISTWGNYPDGDPRRMLLRGIAPVSSTLFYRRSALEVVSWNEDSRLEDYELYLKMMQVGEFAFDPAILSAWRQHGYNTSGDTLLMLNEVIAAQERNFDILGLTRDELIEIQTETRYRYARELLQHGEKRSALKLASANWRGAPETFDLFRFGFRMLIPMAAVNAYRRRKRERFSA